MLAKFEVDFMLLAAETLPVQNYLGTFKNKGPEMWINIAHWGKAMQ